MSDVQARVAELLVKHQPTGEEPIPEWTLCSCGAAVWDYAAHVAAVLAEVGLLTDTTETLRHMTNDKPKPIHTEPVIHDHIGGTKRQRVKALEADVQTLLDRCSYLRQQLDATRAESAEAITRTNRAEAELAELREKWLGWEPDYEEAQARAKKAEVELAGAKDRFDELQRDLSKALVAADDAERRGAVAALREAADEYAKGQGYQRMVAANLRDRADRIEGEDRG